MSASPGDPASLDRLRARVLAVAVRVSAFAMPMLALMAVARAVEEQRVTRLTVIMGSYSLAFPALWWVSRRLRPRTTGAAYIAMMLVVLFVVQTRGGLSAGAGALQVMLVLLGGLLFGGRGVAVALAATLLCCAVAAFLVVGGHVPPVVLSIWNPGDGRVWVRVGMVLTLFGGAAALAVTYMMAELEREAGALRAALEREKAQREALERAEEQTSQARAALDEAARVEALGRMAGGIAHDFNNLLTVIMGASEVARLSPGLSDDVQTCLRDIVSASAQGADLTRGLLLLGRKDLARPIVLDAAALLRRVEGPVRRLLPSDIPVTVEVERAAHVLVDPTQIERVLMNLVANARDALDRDGHIGLSCRCVALGEGEHGLPAGTYVAVSVQDDGAGIDAETQRHIFEPFYTTKQLGAGTGMGMAMVRSIVMDAGGAVSLRSAPGEGTTVTLYLPEIERPTDPVPRASEPVPAGYRPEGRAILLVEDNREVLARTSILLSRQGYDVRKADNGDDALGLLRDPGVAIDLLCIDGVIPGAPSARVIEEAGVLRPNTPVLLCSGYVDEELLRRGIQTGELHCVRKPYTAQELLATIARVLGPQHHL